MARRVTGNIYHDDGSAWAGGEISWELLEAFETATGVYPCDIHTETLDALGAFSIDLGTPTTGTAHYRVVLPNFEAHEIYIASGPATDLMTLLTIATSSVTQNAVQTLLDANKILAIKNVNNTYVVLSSDNLVRCTGTFSVTLPDATGSGNSYTIYNYGVGVITIDGDGGDTINGDLTYTLNASCYVTVVDVAAGAWDLFS